MEGGIYRTRVCLCAIYGTNMDVGDSLNSHESKPQLYLSF